MNRKGLTNSLSAIMVLLFLFAIVSVLVIPIKIHWDNAINDLPSNVASDETKELISEHSNQVYWLDTLFVVFLVVLIASYIVTSFTLPVSNAWFFLLFTGFIILVTFIAMILSNSWTYMLTDPFFAGVDAYVPITDYVMRNFPYFMFLTGIIGGVIFYSRSRESVGGESFEGVPPRGGDSF